MFIIANMIGIILSYLGFANADSYANEAQSAQLSNLRTRVEEILGNEQYAAGIKEVIEQERDRKLQEIQADHAEHYGGYELVVIDEYETKLKGNMGYYLAVLMAEKATTARSIPSLGMKTAWVLICPLILVAPMMRTLRRQEGLIMSRLRF